MQHYRPSYTVSVNIHAKGVNIDNEQSVQQTCITCRVAMININP